MMNCTIQNSYALYGSAFYVNENRNHILEIYDCIFLNNSAYYTISDLGLAKMISKNSIFKENKNILFSLDSSNCTLINSSILHHSCWITMEGCAINSRYNSSFLMNFVFLENILSHFEEGNFYSEEGSFQIYASIMIGLFNGKFKGACFSNYNSALNITESFFSNYSVNCIYSMGSNLTIHDTTFNNTNYLESNAENKYYGAVYCINCPIFKAIKSNFIKNINVINGSAIYLKNERKSINEAYIFQCKFQQNEAEDGTIFIFNQNVSIIQCFFQFNIATRGGGISLYHECIAILLLKIIIF